MLMGLTAALACVAVVGTASAAWTPSVVGETPQGYGVFRFPQAVGVSPGGQTVFVGDQNSSVVQAFGPDGQFKFSLGYQSARGEAGRIGAVGGVATDHSGHVYVLDAQNQRVQVFDQSSGAYLAQFGDATIFDLIGGNPQTSIGGGRSASGIAVAQGPGQPPVVYVADQGNERVARFVIDPATLRPSAAPTFSPASVDLSAPQGVALNPAGTTVFVADDDHHRIVVLDATSLAQTATIGSLGTGPGQLQNPYDVAVDSHDPNRLFVADNLNNRVDVFDATSPSYGFLGTLGQQGYGPGTGNMAIVRSVGALTDTPGGGVDVADTANDRIQAFDVNDGIRSIWGVSGRGPGYFTRPEGVAFAPDGTIAVADSFDERIGLIAPDGTWAGLRGQVSASTGFATEGSNPGQFSLPHDVAYDAAGNLWVADYGNDRVQELGPDGNVINMVAVGRPLGVAAAPGGGVFVAGSRDGVVVRIDAGGAATTVRSGLSHPAAVAVAPDGTPYVADDASVRNVNDNSPVPAPGGGTTWDHPSGLGFGPDGTLYVAEQRPATPDGARVVSAPSAAGSSWTTIATEGSQPGQVVDPGGLAVSADGGTVLVADTGGDRVVRLDADGHAPPARADLTVAVNGGIDRGTVVSDLPGIACVSDCEQHYGIGRTVTLTARPRAGSVIAGWTGACSGTAPTCAVTLGGDRQAGVTFAPAPPPAPPVTPPAPAPKPKPAPVVLQSVRLSTHTLRPARRASRRRHVRARRATRARATVTLTRPATVTVRVLLGRPGRRSGSSCVAPTRRNAKQRRCTYFIRTTRTKSYRPSTKTITFTLTPTFAATRSLSRASYQLSVTAVDADGNRSGPRTASFKVTR